MADGLGVTTAEGDGATLGRGVLLFGAGLTGVIDAAGVGATAVRDGEGADLDGAADRAGTGTTAGSGCGLTTKYAASAARKIAVTTQVVVRTRPISRSRQALPSPARSAG